MTTGRHEPGRSFAGKGLLSNFQRRLLRLKRTLVTPRAHSPVLQIERVRSAQHPAFTPPKVVEPATVSLPAGASPETLMLIGLAGSSLVIRGGYGVYRNTNVYESIARLLAQQPPLSKTLSVENSAANPLTLANGFPLPTMTANTFAVDPDFRVGYAQNW